GELVEGLVVEATGIRHDTWQEIDRLAAGVAAVLLRSGSAARECDGDTCRHERGKSALLSGNGHVSLHDYRPAPIARPRLDKLPSVTTFRRAKTVNGYELAIDLMRTLKNVALSGELERLDDALHTLRVFGGRDQESIRCVDDHDVLHADQADHS